MEVNIQRTDQNFQFTANNGKVDIPVVANPALSGDAVGFRPMELMLSSLGGCMSIDVLLILQKQKQEVLNYRVEVSGERTDAIPSIFKKIELRFFVEGQIEAAKLQRAIDLSKDKYCPAFAIISKSSSIEYKYYLNHE